MPEKIDFSKVSFLLVDANPLALDMIQDILKMLGATGVRRVQDSTKAIKALREDNIDVMITEWELEPMSGLELIDYLRFSPDSPNRLLPVIMLTAHSEQEYVVAARDKGVTEFLAKPFTVDGLYRRLSSVIARPRSFVNAQSYFGPDRRRRQVPHGGPNRRGGSEA
ncbi:MAG: response regulator [Proteobacteria bacterium]|nr:response regulator [Pseudomonadota bacterium]MBI3497331.1 response regulator [Pseudomonadota bacterium]